jgi:hypothetical protein
MYQLSGALAPRFFAVILALLLLLLIVLLLVHAHLGGMPALVQSTESILD